jgi:hypothetical protein
VLVVLAMAFVSAGKRSASSSVVESEGDEPMMESGSMSSAVNVGEIVLVNCVSE